MRKLVLAGLPCLALGLAAPAFAATGAAHDRDTAHQVAVRTDGAAVVGAGQAKDQLFNRERVDRCPLDAILADDCQPRN